MADLGLEFIVAEMDLSDHGEQSDDFATPTNSTKSWRVKNRQIALRLAEVGAPVFPCNTHKNPLVKWRAESTCDARTVEKWWRSFPDAIPAIDLAKAGLIVSDLDRHGGPDGLQNFFDRVGDPTKFGAPMVATANGGVHLYFLNQPDAPFGNSAGEFKGLGVDVRGAGGYVIAPGATLPDGRQWRTEPGSPDLVEAFDTGKIPALPERIAAALRAKPEPEAQAATNCDPLTSAAAAGERERAWARVKLDAQAKELAETAKGGRNNALNEMAYSMGRCVGAGWISQEAVVTALEGACRANGSWRDDGPRTCRATIASGLNAGLSQPHPPLVDREMPGDEQAERLGAQIAAALGARESNPIPNHLAVGSDPETGEIIQGEAPHAAPHAQQPRAVEMEIISAASLAGKPIPAQHWLIKDLIPHGNVTMLAGDGATGKSLLGLQLGAALATGKPWIGFYTEKGRVLFISAEDETAELHRRLARIEPRLDLLSDLIIADLAGKDAVLAAPEGREGLLKPTALFTALERIIARNQPDLLILDTLADLFGGDEIKKVQARQFIGMLRGLALQHDMTVVLLSHPSQSGMNSGTGTSGNTAWNNSVRSRLYLERRLRTDGKRVVEDDRDLRVLSTKKSNRSPTGGQIVLRWKDGKFERETQSAVNAADAAHHADNVFLALLEQFIREKRAVSPNKGPTYAPALFQGHENAKGMRSSELGRAMNRLLQSGRIEVEGFGPPSKPRQRLVIVSQGIGGDVSGESEEGGSTDHDLPEPAD
ncbi:RecA-family ATPase [Rhodoblastus acidophilus]|uniref:AAA family ATPase n=1 Tax=Rhodoblastus acidophilus TaxID=1074 RepID=UPI002225630D|nr:AAA family ATPase [Rhodoblastus acidophilus]MCW2284941.1 RecA-family ATPase [Rhodoblastus acidophilus]MCW2333995.1 RecA-family ATPase [Rhodoblastus acidophilus]